MSDTVTGIIIGFAIVGLAIGGVGLQEYLYRRQERRDGKR